LLQKEREKLPLAVDLECIEGRIRDKEREQEELEEKCRERLGKKTQLDEDILQREEENHKKQMETDRLQSRWNALDDKKEEIAHWEKQHLEMQGKYSELQGMINALDEAKVEIGNQIGTQEQKLKILIDERQQVEEAIEKLKKDEKTLKNRCASLEFLAQRCAEVEERLKVVQTQVDELQLKRQSLEAAVGELNLSAELAQKRTASEKNKLDDLLAMARRETDELNALQQKMKKLQSLCSELEAQEATRAAKLEVWKQQNLEMEQRRKNYQIMLREIGELELLQERRSGIVEAQRKQAEEDSRRAFQGLRTIPGCLRRKWQGKSPVNGEWEALAKLKRYLESRGLTFPERRLHSFHTALKSATTSPLTVLAGISGTGKSLLAKSYADAMGLYFLSLAVQPRWDGPQDLFGFYNYLEKRYMPTELAQAMAHMDFFNAEKNGTVTASGEFRDKMLLVLLDEMNLARVEYYFSDFLSKLEVRRGISNFENSEERQAAEVDLGKESKMGEIRLFPVENILFAGTMNEDESTQTISDKVVDRSNVLSFGSPGKFSRPEEKRIPSEISENYLSFETWKSWCHKSEELPGDALTTIRSGLQSINDVLAKIKRPFGHRVYNAIVEYIANYPEALDHGDIGRRQRARAFNDQVEMRLLPKLRGVDLADGDVEDALATVRDVLEQDTWKDEALVAAFEAAFDKRRNHFTWEGVCRDGDE
jgi:hypothetical protein